MTDDRRGSLNTWRNYVTTEAHEALIRHGYDGDALPCGAVYSSPTATYRGVDGSLLRSHVCELDGIEIDGHEGSDLDPGSTSCIFGDYEGPNP